MQHAIIYAAKPPRCLPCPIFNAAIDVDDDDDDGDGNGNAAKCNNLIAACQAEATQVQHENEGGGGGAAAAAAGREEGNVNPILLRPSSFFCSLRRRHFN